MFFLKKKLKDCLGLIDTNFIGKPLNNKFLSAAKYSFPSVKDKALMDRIYSQKKLVETHGAFEAIYLLAKNIALNEIYVKYEDKINLTIPLWSDAKIFSQSSSKFVLNEQVYIAQQHSSNFNSIVGLYKNDELIFSATHIGSSNCKNDRIDIASSKLSETDLTYLIALANYIEQLGKQERHSVLNNFLEQDAKAYKEKVSKNF